MPGRAIIAERAIAAGLRFQPLADSMSDTLAWGTHNPPHQRPSPP